MKNILYIIVLLFTLTGCANNEVVKVDETIEIIVTENKDQYIEIFNDYGIENQQKILVTQISESDLKDMIERRSISESTDVIIFPSSTYLDTISNTDVLIKLKNFGIDHKFHYDKAIAFAYEKQMIISNSSLVEHNINNYTDLTTSEFEKNILSMPIESDKLKLVFSTMLTDNNDLNVDDTINKYTNNLAQIPIEDEMNSMNKIDNGYASAAIITESMFEQYNILNTQNNLHANELDEYAVDLKLIAFTNNSSNQIDKIMKYLSGKDMEMKIKTNLNNTSTMSEKNELKNEYKKINKIEINKLKLIEQLPAYNRKYNVVNFRTSWSTFFNVR